MRLFILRLCCLLLLLHAGAARADHIMGGDFFYQYISGNTYKVTLVLYGDCTSARYKAGGFNGVSPQIRLYNGTSVALTFNLTAVGNINGTEVTPVCASQLANTSCKNPNSTLQGVMQFTYSATISLPYPYASSNWKFRFEGVTNTMVTAGRSPAITNLAATGTATTVTLEADLNNINGNNSSPRFTTLPTPFYCINVAQQYNQGAVDPDGDVLTYALVAGLTPTGSVGYNSGYSGTSPLAAATGTFSFNSNTGQLAFTPNLAQVSLVVNQVNEYRNGTLVGTAMREMVFVVLPNCTNTPASGKIDSTAPGANIGGIPADPTTYNICQGTDSIRFHILPINPGNDTLYASVQGLPAGATATVLQDSTTTPDIVVRWKTSGLTAGSYNFFVTYKDTSHEKSW